MPQDVTWITFIEIMEHFSFLYLILQSILVLYKFVMRENYSYKSERFWQITQVTQSIFVVESVIFRHQEIHHSMNVSTAKIGLVNFQMFHQ
ncbi:hypothetical protein DW766_00425 [Butyricicoccus sp. AM29-23AC]|nr:hypothetical protein DW766_00425 [Butyricicoccus sp. AM29-23AC]